MTDARTCCSEFLRTATLSRRRLLGGLAAAGATSVTTSLFGQAVQQASYGGEAGGNVVVVLSLRGGIDGLGIVVPHGDPAYYTARPRIAVPKAQLFARDEMFGLHPALAPLGWLWDSGELAAVHAVGMSTPTRSHFAAMEEIEDAAPGSDLRQGWVNRMVGVDGDAVEALHVGTSTPPTLVLGPSPTLAVRALDEVELAGSENGWGARRRRQLAATWGDESGPLGSAARSALTVVDALSSTGRTAAGVAYPTDPQAADLGAALQDTARLVKADLGTEVVSVDFGGWDMHDNYGTLAYGEMQMMAGVFARCVDAFMRDLGPLRSRVTLVTISEFGRRVAENGNRGLDHGWGNMMLLMGGGVKGGRYYGTWPGLGTRSLTEGDLKVTTDYRQVLGEVVHKRFPAKDVTQVFPGMSYAPLGLLAG
ncbi:MAG: Protein of unknown function (DUF1501) [uncultured Nocardioidaceae bacterium]|uniref:DUF1501 domain-containing protein n=1 Tax=uncultured Nocardioidaceae bacterium TaxID=253824 RepID=A0A6J4M5X4_9ACTN|nr:MAG: Protein of unknown function (DUF1501) [uncultured Nocardioidaceae bacterium]